MSENAPLWPWSTPGFFVRLDCQAWKKARRYGTKAKTYEESALANMGTDLEIGERIEMECVLNGLSTEVAVGKR